MIMAEKIAALRRRSGWSQEELAEKMSISRQSVSKWESGASIPDLDKILKMSQLFSVSTDYLLKDELEEPSPASGPDAPEEREGRRVSLEEANAFMELSAQLSTKIAFAIMLFILSPICLILLGGMSESGMFGIGEDLAAGAGFVVLLVIVAAGVGVLLMKGIPLKKYEYLEKERICTEYGVSGIVQKKKEEFMPEFRVKITAGVVLFILGVAPLMIGAGLGVSDFMMCCLVGVLLLMVAFGVFLVVSAGMVSGSYDKLLETGDYTPEEKEFKKRVEFFPGVYWCAVTAIYIGVSFYTDSWRDTWIIFAVAGVLFAAVWCALRTVMGRKNKR